MVGISRPSTIEGDDPKREHTQPDGGQPDRSEGEEQTEPAQRAPSQRERILGIALHLMSEQGVQGMSMRCLADTCGLNVATIYHYFPSKADLLAQVIAERSYEERLLAETPAVDAMAPLDMRLVQFLTWIWDQMSDQDDMWRLLLGESLRGDGDAIATAASLSETFERGLVRWLGDLMEDLPGDRDVAARVLRGLIYGFWIETIPMSVDDRALHLGMRAAEIASILAGTSR